MQQSKWNIEWRSLSLIGNLEIQKNTSGKEAKEIHNCTQIQTQKYLLLEPDPGHKEQFPRIIAEAAKI